ncbi:unnamed protein product [Dovyalis caffra]|uniref:Diacylglycerol O-acyltransferase 3, cytosolic n=1 Tax=Dovyalis caffra TaxID=77055 RepID=A0AAV1R0B3_9ROSI|nr:unnamed protein product [Dovyalis caffra]
MEISGVIARQPPCFSGGGLGDPQTRCEVSMRPRRILNGFGVVNKDHTGFRDKGHLKYYYGSEGLTVRCGGKKKDKETSSKKKLKLLRELSRDLSVPHNGLVGDVQASLISEATQVLMKQLQQLRAEEKELKRKKKEEKAKLKAAKMKTMLDCESSSSSESSDSECGKVIDMNRLRKEAVAEPEIGELQPVAEAEPTSILPSLLTQESNTTEINGFHDRVLGILGGQSTGCINTVRVSCNETSSSMTAGTSAKKIEVCMGNKCKKSGGVALLEEFDRTVGIEGAVVGCKCMGKCRDGPNVRLLNSGSVGVDDSIRTPANPLCVGVGLDDVDVIVANFFGKELSVAPAT